MLNKEIELVKFPDVENVSPRLLGDDIKGYTAEETRIKMKKMFDEFEKVTGYKTLILCDSLPTNIIKH